MKVYVIKIAVRGVSPMVWRRLRVAADTSLAALHFIIQIIQGWSDDHLHQFHIYGKDYGITYDGSIGFPDNPFQVVIDDFEFDVGDRFTYEYNFFEHWIHDVTDQNCSPEYELQDKFASWYPGSTIDAQSRGTLSAMAA
ncbi:prophage protein [Escherichia coli]|nr:prophage protein [Escherichia coli]CAD6107954.1 prophage protein [Escherichia coli]CAD6550905.1 prophage protein [Escherichia coli]